MVWLGSIFMYKKESLSSIKKNQLNEERCENEFLLLIIIDSRCLSIGD